MCWHQVTLVGFVPPEELPAAYACMDVYVGPYVYPATETFALTNLEAMAMGVPFIHFNTGGIRVCNPLLRLRLRAQCSPLCACV